MAIHTYHDFVIFTDDVEKDEAGRVRSFSVRVFYSPVGEGEKKDPVTIPADIDLERWSRRLEQRRLDADVEQQMELGARLADLLLPRPYARELYQRSLAWLHQDEGLRLRLRLADELVALPWEYMYLQDAHGERTPSGFLALDPRLSIVRHEAIAIPAGRFGPAEKRRILVVMATPQPYTDYPQLKNLPREQKLIRGALGDVAGIDITYIPEYDGIGERPIPGATVEDVRAAMLPSADVFHFSGHGEFVEGMGPVIDTIEGEGAIILADGHNQAVSVSGDRLAEIIRGKGVRLVVLGCCEAAKRDIFHKWSSVAASLLKGRIPSVVAMQFTIQDDLAAAFMGTFYQALVAGLTIDEAVALGRGAIRDKALGERTHVRDWGAPVLYLRTPGGRIFNPVTDEEASQEAERKSNQRFRLHQAWWEWMAHGVMPSTDQLQHLAEASESLELSPVQTLLLLRSAVAIDVSVTPWLDRLRLEGGGLIEKLDNPQSPDLASLAEARQILRLDGESVSDRPEHVGPVSWSAVRHHDRVTRQTAALALTALESVPQEGLNRLKQALGEWDGHRRPWWRQAELHGTLADADPELEKLNTKQLSTVDRAGIWLWRVRRRVLRGGQRIVGLTLGGAIGAGLGLGLLRTLLGIPARQPMIAVLFAMYFYWAAFLGGAIGLGIALADPLLLRPTEDDATPSNLRTRVHPDRLPALLAAGLSILAFGLVHLVVALFNGLSLIGSPLVAPMGFVAGLGLAIALFDQPGAGWHLGIKRWSLRLGAVSVIFVLTQLVFILAGDDRTGIAVAWTGAFYRAEFTRYVSALWPQLMGGNCFQVMALIDAVLVGIALTIGISAGLLLIAPRLMRWQALIRQADD